MSKKTIITGTLILTTANLITKFMGFFYRVFMSNAIGAEGMGLYQLILPIYVLTWSITSAGFTTTISRLSAQENVLGQSGNIGRIVKQSILLSLGLSLIVSSCLFLFSDQIALSLLKDGRAALSLRLLSFAIPFMAAGSCFRGFFIGLQNTLIPAFSQVLEQAIRILTIYLLAGIFVPMGLTYACCAAVAGVVLGEFLSFVFVIISYLRFKRRKKMIKKPSLSPFAACNMILTMAIPLSATRIAGSLLATTENILIPRQLQLFGQNAQEALSSYGELTGMAMPLILLPSACLMAASVSLVPEISEACAVQQNHRISQTVSVTFLFTFIIGIGAAALFAVFPREICYIVYNRQGLGELLFPLAFLCPFIYAQTTLHGLLNGMGEQFFLFRNNLVTSVITIAGIWFFMPLYGIPAFLVSWALGLVYSVGSCLYKLYIRTGVFPEFGDCFIKPLLAGAASGLIVRYIIRISTPSKILFFLSLMAMGLLYLVFLLLLGCFSKENMTTFMGEKSKKHR
ncbi:putative polysaccharide biosynthesis protein [Anaerotignum sp.]|uniref:putative polysaccharide biosynthesis protein n=1 Tax=Anaerotignum sp. TaxID=2039241 RepID=UPI0027146A27|nr:polysaccharide biosynthesis protein [Anaerotignum sp.]